MIQNYKTNFEEHGFVILKNVFNEEELNRVRTLQEKITAYADKGLVDPFLPWSISHRSDQGVLYDLHQRHPEFQTMTTNSQVLDCLESILGKDIFLYENSLIYKPKGRSNGVPWHQDFISRPHEPLKIIVWMALDKVTKENGALQIIPGSHKNGHLPWHRVHGETHHDRVNMEFVDKYRDKIVFVELEPGDVLLFNMLVMHGSDEVHSDLPRRAYRCSYQSLEKKIYSPRQSPIVVRGGDPEKLSFYYPDKKAITKPNLIQKILRRAGNKLIELSK